MKTYTVRSGENIFDVAINIYGGIEGIFDLLVQNSDAETQSGLSLADTLQPGMVLKYTEDFMVNKNIADWLHGNNLVVRNGEHTYSHFEPVSYITVYARRYNAEVCKQAVDLGLDREQLIQYIKDKIVLCSSEPDYDAIMSGNYESVSEINISEQIKIPTHIVKQTGVISIIDAECEVIIIDWGDNTWPSVYFGNTRGAVEHCYEDGGVHIIKIYALNIERLNLANAGEYYYAI